MNASVKKKEKEDVMHACNKIREDSYSAFSQYTKLLSYKVTSSCWLEQTLRHHSLDITKEDTLLGIGPGYNLFTYYSALRNQCSLDLIDIDRKVLSYHRHILKKGSFSEINSKQIKGRFPCADGCYSKAFCISTSEQIFHSEYVDFLKEVDKVLQPKGRIVFSFPYTSHTSSVRMIQTNQFSFPENTSYSYFIQRRLLDLLGYSTKHVAYIRPITKNIKATYGFSYPLGKFFRIVTRSDTFEQFAPDIRKNKKCDLMLVSSY